MEMIKLAIILVIDDMRKRWAFVYVGVSTVYVITT